MTRTIEPIIEQNKTESENKLAVETTPLHSNSEPSKMLLATYVFLLIIIIFVVILIFAFNDLLKNTMKLFNALLTSVFSLLKLIFD